MIAVTDLHGEELYVNAEMIQSVELTPDTQIALSNGHRIYVKESPEEVAERVIAYRQSCGPWISLNGLQPDESEEALSKVKKTIKKKAIKKKKKS